MEALRIFGCDDDDDVVKRGINFLLKDQNQSDGSWDRVEGNDAYTVYHATMVGVQGLLPSSAQGFGPGDLSVVEVLKSWQESEENKLIEVAMSGEIEDRLWAVRRTFRDASKAMEKMFRKTSGKDANNNTQVLKKNGDQVNALVKKNIMASQKRLKLFSQLEKHSEIQIQKALSELHRLNKYKIGVDLTLDFLNETKLMKTVNKLRKHKNSKVSSLSKKIRSAWKEQYNQTL